MKAVKICNQLRERMVEMVREKHDARADLIADINAVCDRFNSDWRNEGDDMSWLDQALNEGNGTYKP